MNERRRPLGLHRTVLLLAGTHFIVDGYGNILTPLLPLLISELNLSLAGAGTLTMFFQLANSVTQLGFGHLADRWRPRLLLLIGPIVGVSMLPLIGLAPTAWMLALLLIAGGLGGAAFHPPAAALVHRYAGPQRGLAMSFHITRPGGGANRFCTVRPDVRPWRDAVADAAGTGCPWSLPVAAVAILRTAAGTR
jgi:MFS family permease